MQIYMSAKERERYSLRSLLLAKINDKRSLELDVSDQIARDLGKQPKGVFIPAEILLGPNSSGLRGLNVTSPAAGGFTVGTNADAIAPIEYLFGQSVVFRLGAQFLADQRSDISVPRVKTSDEAEWLLEGQIAQGQDSTFGHVAVKPHRCYAERSASKQLIIQSRGGDALVQRLVFGALAAAIDRAALAGTGGVRPVGILSDPNTPAISSGNNGGVPTLTILNQAEGAPITAKVPMTAPGWVMSPGARLKMKGTAKAAGQGFLVTTDPTTGTDVCNGYRAFPTAFLPDDLTKGSGTALGSAIFGADWSTLTVVQFGPLDLIVDGITKARQGLVEIAVESHVDIAKTRPDAFAKIEDMVTTL